MREHDRREERGERRGERGEGRGERGEGRGGEGRGVRREVVWFVGDNYSAK